MSIECPLCKFCDTTLITSSLRFGFVADVYHCVTCSLVFLDQSSFRYPANFYQTEYHQTYLTHVDPDILDPAKHYAKMQTASRMWIDRVRGMLTGVESVLDVGCSTGHVLMGICDKADKIYGHELSKKEVKFCREMLDLDVADIPLHSRF